MLLFIATVLSNNKVISKFQYISCYCLSAIQQLKESKKLYFNTSYVTVYPMALEVSNCSFRFQYISCYCLSPFPVRSHSSDTHFNTSHVTVYPAAAPEVGLYNISIHLMLLFIYYRYTG